VDAAAAEDAAGAAASGVAAVAGLSVVEVAAALLAAEVAAAAAGSGSDLVASGSVAAGPAPAVRVARAAAYPGERAACAESDVKRGRTPQRIASGRSQRSAELGVSAALPSFSSRRRPRRVNPLASWLGIATSSCVAVLG
jgi:hypothetical protein